MFGLITNVVKTVYRSVKRTIMWTFGIGPDWKTVFRGSPVDPNVGSYMINDDVALGLLDSGLLAY